MNKIITIGREFGSGGRELGRLLAEEAGAAYYDKEILKKMAEDTNFSEEYISRTVENRNSLLLPITVGHSFDMPADYQIMQLQEIYRSQTKIIREIAEAGPCVIIGRCADYILRDMHPFRIFVYADIESRIKRCRDRRSEDEPDYTDQELKKLILAQDKERAHYYNDFTFQKWGDCRYYDICVNTTNLDVAQIAKGLAKYF